MRLFAKPGRPPVAARWALAVALATTLAATLVGALAAPGAGAADYPKAIQSLVASGFQVERHFPAASGLTGWVVKHRGQYNLLFTTADGQTLISGALIDAGGRNLTADYIDKYVPKPDYSAAFKQLQDSAYIVEGTQHNPKSVLYVFTDANCPYCHAAWKALQPYQAHGLQVRWIPVAVLRPSSVDKGVAMLAAKDREAAFRRDMQHFGQPHQPTVKVSAAERAKYKKVLQRNGALMAKFDINGTPGIVWRKSDGQIGIKPGMPRLRDIPAMTGLPLQANNDPELARFN